MAYWSRHRGAAELCLRHGRCGISWCPASKAVNRRIGFREIISGSRLESSKSDNLVDARTISSLLCGFLSGAVERSRSGSLLTGVVAAAVARPSPDGCLTLCWIPCVSFLPLSKEIHHGSASRSDGTGPQTQRRQSRHHPQLPRLLSQVRRVLHAFYRRTRRRRSQCLSAAPDRSRTTGLCQLSPGVCCPQVPL